MGAVFQSMTLPRSKSPAAVRAAFAAAQADDRRANGCNYTGGFAMCDGLEIVALPPFASIDDAEEWLSTQTDKWGPAKACTAKPEMEEFWVIGAWCAE